MERPALRPGRLAMTPAKTFRLERFVKLGQVIRKCVEVLQRIHKMLTILAGEPLASIVIV